MSEENKTESPQPIKETPKVAPRKGEIPVNFGNVEGLKLKLLSEMNQTLIRIDMRIATIDLRLANLESKLKKEETDG